MPDTHCADSAGTEIRGHFRYEKVDERKEHARERDRTAY